MARAAAGALIRNRAGEVLMVEPTYKAYWDLPGGYIEIGESPSVACRREVREELGIDVALGELLVVDWAPAANEGDKILFIFDGGTLTAEQEDAITLPAAELKSYAYQPVERLAAITPARLSRRIGHAIQAGTTMYLENGEPLPHTRSDAA
ncbi:NUDIX hydrolase [Natronoglycomyces albus]|uniref:NUDIX domain-containing protein n=1 Tax=Natronoglycomyces albus TaxID=2811108 RepID=UPI002483AD82|nr:NUDIX hydrolase [Natronoglycomyces albus]